MLTVNIPITTNNVDLNLVVIPTHTRKDELKVKLQKI